MLLLGLIRKAGRAVALGQPWFQLLALECAVDRARTLHSDIAAVDNCMT